MGKLFRFIKRFLCLYLSCLSRRKSNIYVFGSWEGKKFADNPKYMYLYALTLPDIQAVWITKSEAVYEELHSKGYPVYMANSKEGIRYELKAKYIFICVSEYDVNENFVGGATIIDFWHGVPLKKVAFDDKITFDMTSGVNGWKEKLLGFPKRKHYYVSTSETFSKIYLHAFRTDEKHIVQVGQTRNDVFYSTEISELKRRYNTKKVIVYMPTHRQEGRVYFDCEKLFDLAAVDEFCERNNAVFLIKKHFYHRNDPDMADTYKNIFDITKVNVDSQELLKATDILITDYSSCYIDFLLLDRPLLFYDFDLSDYLEHDRGMYFDYDEVTPGIKAQTYEDLMKALTEIIENNIDVMREKRKECLRLFYDEKACQPVSPLIQGLIENGRFDS